MHLWTEYEGRTIAGSYTLGKLLRSEGRNGFFATSNTTGNAAVIRLTESHFDEEEVLKRWRQVAELHQANLIEIERVGQTRLDDVALTYALMERNDANLEDVLKERPLTNSEATEVAKSVLAAIKTLHASGLVHEHIEPVNVLAVGDVVKLRSDCVRECVADGEFTSEEACQELRKRDVHDFGTLLLRCLTLERELTPSVKLAEPFHRVVPGAIEGTLSLAQLEAVLNPPASAQNGSGAPYATSQPASMPASANGTRTPLVPNGVRAAAVPVAAVPAVAAATDHAAPAEPSMRMRRHVQAAENTPTPSPLKLSWIIGGVAALIVLFLAWYLLSSKSAPAADRPASTVAAPTTQPSAKAAPVGPAAPAAAPAQATAPAQQTHAAVVSAAHGTGWYVIAYTYNREDQARAKAARVSRRGGPHAEVFSPSGRAPYLVSLGGPMNEREAKETLWRARRAGSPRDTFIRRY